MPEPDRSMRTKNELTGNRAGERSTSRSSARLIDELGQILDQLEIIDAGDFGELAAPCAGDFDRVLDSLRRHGYLSRFQIEKIQTEGADSLKFDDYVLLDRLGQGGAGEVFKARNLVLGRLEAIKVIQTDVARNDVAARRFQREARVLAQLEHSAVVPIHKIGRFGDVDYIAMKFVEGKTLQKRIDEANQGGLAIPVATACRWMIEAADALDYAHRQGIIHRDIKPGNLMVTLQGRIMVLDMGIARLTDPGLGKDQVITVQARGMGTPEYMPPEQWADATAVSPASDVYSLGCTFVHLLTGRPPYSGRLNQLLLAHTTAPIPKIRDLRKDVPKTLDEIIARMLAKQAKDRYPALREFIEALTPVLQKLPNDGRSVSSLSIDPSAAAETARAIHGAVPTQVDGAGTFVSMTSTASAWNIDLEKPKWRRSLAPAYWAMLFIAIVLAMLKFLL